MSTRIYGALAVINGAIAALNVSNAILVGWTPLTPLWIGCSVAAAVIFIVLAMKWPKAPRQDTGIYLRGAGGWKYPRYRQDGGEG